ncbi:uncharacterized protein [Euwallacea similis]|uniref:uncharacterized protein n=1 Tax=Euwallacea similis TaxID=1736056 RepID=UPI00344FF043
MYYSAPFLLLSMVLVVGNAQFSQFVPQFSESSLQSPYGNPLQQSFYPFKMGGYQLLRPPPPHMHNPFSNVFNEKGEKLNCRMVCSPMDDLDEINETNAKKESGENKVGKKENDT